MTTENTVTEIQEVSTNTHGHHGYFYQDPAFWVGFSFILVVLIIYKPIKKASESLITKRILNIRNKFKEAEDLKIEAQKLYAKYERKLSNVEKEVSAIVKEEKSTIEDTKEKKIKDLNKLLVQKQKELDGKIELSINKVNSEINYLVSKKAIETIKDVVSSKLTTSDYSKLIDKSIENIQTKF